MKSVKYGKNVTFGKTKNKKCLKKRQKWTREGNLWINSEIF